MSEKDKKESKVILNNIISLMEKVGMLHNYYFTFGSLEQYPYHDGYLIVKAKNIEEAAAKFDTEYPNPHDSEVLNCSDYYTQQQWDNEVKKYYENEEPQEIIF